MKNEVKIAFAVIVSFSIAFSMLYFVLNWEYNYFDPYKTQNGTYSEFLTPNSNKIFLLGSSQVGRLNATIIQNYLLEHGKNYDVYNLATSSDNPPLRLLSLQIIISAKPALVVYGLGYRDFQSTQQNENFATLFDVPNVKSPLPDPHDLFAKSLYATSLDNTLLVFRNPQFLTLGTLETFLGKPFPVSDDTLLLIWSAHPDLQSNFPEVKKGNLENLKKWAVDYGWNQTEVLHSLTPPHKIPAYLKGLNQTLYPNTSSNTPFFVYHSVVTPIKNSTELNLMMEDPIRQFKGFNPVDTEKSENALEKIITGLRNNDIKLVFFTAPHSKIYLDTISEDDKKTFISIFKRLYDKFGVETVYLHDKYQNLNIWSEPSHVSMNSTVSIYNEDVAKIILKEIR